MKSSFNKRLAHLGVLPEGLDSPASGTLAAPATGAIRRLGRDQLERGGLYEQFRSGAQVVTVAGDVRVPQLWRSLVSDVGDGGQVWAQNVFQLARNHIPGENNFGDILKFAEEQYGHIGRKVGFFPDARGGGFRVYPSPRVSHRTELNERVFRAAWSLAMEVQESACPRGFDPDDYAVSIEILKYAESRSEHQHLLDMIGDSAGPWTTLGRRLDRARSGTKGFFQAKYLRDLYACGSVVPGLGRLLRSINARAGNGRYYALEDDRILAGPPHIDDARFLTMLCGNRDAVTTEVFDGDRWQEIPITTNDLSVFPGARFRGNGEVEPVVHRYTICDNPAAPSCGAENVTLLIGTIPREMIAEYAEFQVHDVLGV